LWKQLKRKLYARRYTCPVYCDPIEGFLSVQSWRMVIQYFSRDWSGGESDAPGFSAVSDNSLSVTLHRESDP